MKKKRLKIFGERLNALRGDLTQAQFAEKTGLTAATVGYYLNSDRLPDAETLAKICKACNVSADYLIGLSSISNPDVDTQTTSKKFGLTEPALSFLEYLNKPLSIDCEEAARIVDKLKAYENHLEVSRGSTKIERTLNMPPVEPLTDEEWTAYLQIGNFESRKKMLHIVNDILGTSSGGLLIGISNYIYKEFKHTTQTIDDPALGKAVVEHSPDDQRYLEILKIHTAIRELRKTLLGGDKE